MQLVSFFFLFPPLPGHSLKLMTILLPHFSSARGWRIIGMYRHVIGLPRRTKYTLVLLFWLSNYRSIGPQEIKINQESLVRRSPGSCQRRNLSPGYLQLVKGLAGSSGWDGDGHDHTLAKLVSYIYHISYLNLPPYQNLKVVLVTGFGIKPVP